MGVGGHSSGIWAQPPLTHESPLGLDSGFKVFFVGEGLPKQFSGALGYPRHSWPSGLDSPRGLVTQCCSSPWGWWSLGLSQQPEMSGGQILRCLGGGQVSLTSMLSLAPSSLFLLIRATFCSAFRVRSSLPEVAYQRADSMKSLAVGRAGGGSMDSI